MLKETIVILYGIRMISIPHLFPGPDDNARKIPQTIFSIASFDALTAGNNVKHRKRSLLFMADPARYVKKTTRNLTT
jgi:hypothetical protein